MAKYSTIERDVVVADGESIDTVVTNMIEHADVPIKWLLLEESGPAAHPLVLFVGSQHDIEHFAYLYDEGMI